MSDAAPERIWVDPGAMEIVQRSTKIEPDYDIQYIRLSAHASALAAARAEGRREGLLEAAGIAEHGSFAFDIEVWLTATKKEMTAKVALAIAEAICAAAEVSP
jgi:hypothetical protein